MSQPTRKEKKTIKKNRQLITTDADVVCLQRCLDGFLYTTQIKVGTTRDRAAIKINRQLSSLALSPATFWRRRRVKKNSPQRTC